MRIFVLFLGLLLSLTMITSCEGDEDKFPDCSLVLCPPNSFLLNYQDTDGNPLINTVFVKDSFKLFNPTSTQFIRTLPEENRLAVLYERIESGANYFLELDTDEIDTLMFHYTTRAETCCTIFTLDSLQFNGVTTPFASTEQIVLVRE